MDEVNSKCAFAYSTHTSSSREGMQIDRTDSIAMSKQTKFELLKQELNFGGYPEHNFNAWDCFPRRMWSKPVEFNQNTQRDEKGTRAKDVKGKEELGRGKTVRACNGVSEKVRVLKEEKERELWGVWERKVGKVRHTGVFFSLNFAMKWEKYVGFSKKFQHALEGRTVCLQESFHTEIYFFKM